VSVFDLVPGWVWAIVCVVLLVVAGGSYVMWSRSEAAFAQYQAEVAQATQKAEAQARERERQLTRKSERVARDALQREQEMSTRLVAADDALRGLRDDIDAVDARRVPADAESAAIAVEARAARELLGACAARYRGVAQQAQGLADQVTGLQQFVSGVCAQ
jgi:chromosome segregation ATPase